MAFKDNLTKLLNLFNLSNTDLSKGIHVDASVISRWKNGGRSIPLKSPHLYNLARFVLGLQRNDFQKSQIDKIMIISLSEEERQNPELCIKTLMDWLVTEHNGTVDPMERAIFDKSPVAIAITRAGRILFTNKTCLDLLGATATGEIRGRQFSSFFGPDGPEVEIETEQISLPDGPAQSHFIFDITDQRYLEKRFQHLQSVQRLLLDIAKAFARTPVDNLDELIDSTLRRIGIYDGSERCFIYQYSSDRQTISNTFEWCAEGIQPHKPTFQDRPATMLEWWNTHNQTEEYLYIPDVSALPNKAAPERDYLSQRQVKSLLSVPIIQERQATGILGLATFTATRLWSDESIQLLEFVAQIIASSLTRKQYYRVLQEALKKQECKGGIISGF